MSLVINVDVDGVLYDFHSEMERLGTFYFTRGVMPPPTQWHVWFDWGISRERWWRFFGWAISQGVFRNGDAIEDGRGINAIKMWSEDGHRVRLVTSKGGPTNHLVAIAQRDCISWLEQEGVLPFVEVAFTGGDKSGYLADVIIDDQPNLKWCQEGARNLMLAQPWNVTTDHPLGGVLRVANWEDLITNVEIFSEVTA